MSRPEPRPALRRSEDGSVHPAAPRVEPEKHLHPVPNAPAAARRPASQAPAVPAITHTEFTGKPAKLDVEIPKDLRKQLRRLAERSGTSLDAVVTDALAQLVADQR
jgi:hypothetical protein